jgi:bifunctional non-homologous end joining protein LigD
MHVGPRHGVKKRIVCDNVETLQWLANLAALTIHQWTSHVPPGPRHDARHRSCARAARLRRARSRSRSGPWAHLVQVARAVRALLDALKLESFVKTSGKRGVHVVVPDRARRDPRAGATSFAEQVARAVAKVLPDVAPSSA